MSLYNQYQKSRGIESPASPTETPTSPTPTNTPTGGGLYSRFKEQQVLPSTTGAPASVGAPSVDMPETVVPPKATGSNVGIIDTLKHFPKAWQEETIRMASNLNTGFLKTLSSTARGFEWLGIDRAKPVADKLSEWGDIMQKGRIDGRTEQNFVDALQQGAGSATSFFIPSIGVMKGTALFAKVSPRLAMFFGGSAMAGLESMAEAGDAYETALNDGASKDDAQKRGTAVFGVNILLNSVMNRIGIFNPDTKGLIKRALLSAPPEAIQEAVQTLTQNIASGKDPMEGVVESGAIGGILAPFMGGVVGMMGDTSVPVITNKKDTINLGEGAKGLYEKFLQTTGGDQAQKIADAIKQVESGGNYNAKGASGENGAYQFMPATWKQWAKQYLGNANAPMSNENQDKVALAKINELLKQGRTPREIALIWNGGTPKEKKGVNSKGVAYDSGAYANKVMAQLGKNVPTPQNQPQSQMPTEQTPAVDMNTPASQMQAEIEKTISPEPETPSVEMSKGITETIKKSQEETLRIEKELTEKRALLAQDENNKKLQKEVKEIRNRLDEVKLTPIAEEARKFNSVDEFVQKTFKSDNKYENLVQFHGTQKGTELRKAIDKGEVRASDQGLMGKGFYVTSSMDSAEFFGKQIYNPKEGAREGTSKTPDIVPISLAGLNIKEHDFGKSEYYDFLSEQKLSADEYNEKLKSEGYDGLNLLGRGETIIFDPSNVKTLDFNKLQGKTQKDIVAEVVKDGAKTIKQVAEETGIKEPNIRRILGEGAKEGVFERVDKGVYILNNGKEDVAFIHTGDAVDTLPKLAEKGLKVDMVFLDIPYNTPSVKGGNRGVKYDLVSVDDFRKVMKAVSQIVRTEETPVYYMFSQAESGLKQMMKYNDVLTETGFQVVAKGNWQKMFDNGKPVTNVRGQVARPEGILLLNKKGEFIERDSERNLDFTLRRPKGYQTEKPEELLKSLILQGTKKGETVLDPFAGSGVTGAEAVKTGRKAVLIEKNKEVAEKVTKPRVAKAVALTAKDRAEIATLEGEMTEIYKNAGQSPQMPEFTLAEQKLAEIESLLETSRAGERIFTGYGSDAQVIGVPSTFPKWIPENLRSSDLFDKLSSRLDINNLKMPEGNKTRQRELFNVLMNELDAQLGVDTKALRDKINTLYGTQNNNKEGRAGSDNQRARGDQDRGETEGRNKEGKYPTIHQGGVIKLVEGELIELVDGVETFLHKDENNNWVVSEATTGRSLSDGGFENSTFAVKRARENIEQIGEEKFKKMLEENKLPQEKKGEVSAKELLKEKYPAIDWSISETDTEINLSKIVVPKESRGSGIGTKAMEDLIRYADENKKRIVLTPSKDFGASSVARLVEFYKRFGFVENKGRSRDFSTREAMIREAKNSQPLSGSAGASIGRFRDDSEVIMANPENLKPIQFPELVALAKELSGNDTFTKKYTRANGRFYGKNGGEIGINRELFLRENLGQLTKTMAHEIGHLVDYLPDETLTRGNLMGRLNTLKDFRKDFFAPAGASRTDKELREQMWELSKWWKPIDESTATPSYLSYRKSAPEIYADFISVLFNDPRKAGEVAPTAYNIFFQQLDKKPEVKKAYFELQHLLRNGDLTATRRDRVKDMFKTTEQEARERQIQEQIFEEQRERSIWFKFKTQFVDITEAVREKVKQAEKEGKYINPDDNPTFYLNERNYLGGKIKAEVDGKFNTIYQELQKDDMSWEDLGELMFYERILKGDRQDIANPLGFQPDFVQELYDAFDGEIPNDNKQYEGSLSDMKSTLGQAKFERLQFLATEYRQNLKQLFVQGREEGLYGASLEKLFEENAFYIPFKGAKYSGTRSSFAVKHQKGTLGAIENPANSGIEKGVSIIKAIERNKVARKTVDFMQENFPSEVVEAKLDQNGYPLPSREKHLDLVTYMKDGKVKGFYVDKYIADAIKKNTVGEQNLIISSLRFMNARLFRPLFITFNLGFQSFNFIRDFKRFWKNVPDMTLLKAMKFYSKSVRASKIRAFGLPKNPSQADLDAHDLINKLEDEQLLAITFNDIIKGEDIEQAQIDRILREVGLKKADPKSLGKLGDAVSVDRNTPVIKQSLGLLDFIENTGNFIESLPKIAGVYALEGKMQPREMRDFVRKYVGSPDFLAGGKWKPMSNEVFLFSNAIFQGIRADYEIATKPRSRGAYWMKTAQSEIVPKLLMLMATAGLFGDEIKKLFANISEYDKSNYIVVPMGFDQNGKTVYVRIPSDESGRLLGGLFWKIANSVRDPEKLGDLETYTNLLAYAGGQVPSITPTVSNIVSVGTFVSGNNPYDFFRARPVLTDDQMRAGGAEKVKPFLAYMFQQMGGNVFMKLYYNETVPKNPSLSEKIVSLPVASNIVGRFVKVSDYGQKEQLRQITDEVRAEDARENLRNRRIVFDYVDRSYGAGDAEVNAIKREMFKEVFGDLPRTKDERTKARSLEKRFDTLRLRGSADAKLDALLTAQTNDEKVALLVEYEKLLSKEEFSELQRFIIKNKVVSSEAFRKFKEAK